MEIQEHIHILPRNQRLFFKHTQLLGSQTLKDLNQTVVCLALVTGPLLGGGKDLPSIKDVETWFISSYQMSVGESVSKESIYMNACHYFDKFTNKETLRRFIFETLGRHILDEHKDFKGVKIKKGRKTIMHLATKPTVKPSESVFQRMGDCLYKPTSEYQSVTQEREGNPHELSEECTTQEMAGYPEKPSSMSASQETEGHPHASTTEPLTKEMASQPHEPNRSAPQEINSHSHLPNQFAPQKMDSHPDVPNSECAATSISASQETESYPPTSTSESVTKEIVSHTDQPNESSPEEIDHHLHLTNESAPQEMDDQPDMPTSEPVTKEMVSHTHKPSSSAAQEIDDHLHLTNKSARQEMDDQPDMPTSEPVTKEMTSHTDKPSRSVPQKIDDHLHMTNESTPQEMDDQPDMPTSESVTKEMVNHIDMPSRSAPQEIDCHLHLTNESPPWEMNGHPHLLNMSPPQEMDGQSNVPKEMAGHPTKPTSISASQETESYISMVSHTDKPNRSTPQEIDSHLHLTNESAPLEMEMEVPDSESVTKEMVNHTDEPNSSAPQEIDGHPHLPNESAPQEMDGQSDVIASMVYDYHTEQETDIDISMDWVGNSTSDSSCESGFHSKLSRDEGFSRASIVSRSWSNYQIKELRPKDLNCTSFEHYLNEHIPYPSPRINNDERKRIYQESSTCSNNLNNIFRAYLCYAFPPIDIPKNLANEFKDVTYVHDQFPQFTCVCSSSIRNKTRVSISCEICTLYERSCLRRGKFMKLGKSTVKTFDGVAQVIAHSQSRVHQAAASYLSGLNEQWEDDPNTIVSSASESKFHQPRQKTITEALKIASMLYRDVTDWEVRLQKQTSQRRSDASKSPQYYSCGSQ